MSASQRLCLILGALHRSLAGQFPTPRKRRDGPVLRTVLCFSSSFRTLLIPYRLWILVSFGTSTSSLIVCSFTIPDFEGQTHTETSSPAPKSAEAPSRHSTESFIGHESVTALLRILLCCSAPIMSAGSSSQNTLPRRSAMKGEDGSEKTIPPTASSKGQFSFNFSHLTSWYL